MKSPAVCSLVAVCLLFAFAFFALSAPAQKPADTDGAAPAWEHLALTHDSADLGGDGKLARQIVQLGQKGWELVTVSNVVKDGSTTKTIFYFKRMK